MNMNTVEVETCVLTKHIPSGINIKVTHERSQGLNKDLALKHLKAQSSTAGN
jgi:protein subunit release factor A